MRGFRNPLVCMYGPRYSFATVRSLRIQLDDQAFVDDRRQLGALRQRLELAFQRLGVHLDLVGVAAGLGGLRRSLDAQLLLRLLGDFHGIARAYVVRRNVHALAVYEDAVVAHDLARLGAARAEAHAVG